MILRSFDNSDGGGFDLRNYVPFGSEQGLSATTSYQTVLSISGEGFLSRAFSGYGGASIQSKTKITIDGIAVFEGSLDINGSGFVTEEQITINDGSPTAGVLRGFARASSSATALYGALVFSSDTTAKTIPSISQKSKLVTNLPIFFNVSCIVEIASNINGGIPYSVAGGLLV